MRRQTTIARARPFHSSFSRLRFVVQFCLIHKQLCSGYILILSTSSSSSARFTFFTCRTSCVCSSFMFIVWLFVVVDDVSRSCHCFSFSSYFQSHFQFSGIFSAAFFFFCHSFSFFMLRVWILSASFVRLRIIKIGKMSDNKMNAFVKQWNRRTFSVVIVSNFTTMEVVVGVTYWWYGVRLLFIICFLSIYFAYIRSELTISSWTMLVRWENWLMRWHRTSVTLSTYFQQHLTFTHAQCTAWGAIILCALQSLRCIDVKPLLFEFDGNFYRSISNALDSN